jgi:spore maturation protein CgeB/thioredoxin-like negative regulator of GroEL
MATPRILTFNFHEPYLCLMAETGLAIDVGVYEHGPLARAWHAQFRPAPTNLTFIREAAWRERLESGYYDVVIAQNESNAMDVARAEAARLLICHNRRTFLKTTITGGEEAQTAYAEVVDTLAERFEFIYISQSKQADYGLPGRVISPGFDVEAWGGYTGEVPCAIRVGNTMRQRDLMFDVDFQEACCGGLANRVVGMNPLIPGSEPSSSFEDLLHIYRSNRCLLHVSREAYEDGYNLAMLEAMACGMPVVALANPTSPITNGVDGYTSYDSAELHGRIKALLADRDLAREIGAKGRECIARTFPLEAFRDRWREAIFEAADRNATARRAGRSASARQGLSTLVTFASTPHTTGRYVRDALRKSNTVVTAGVQVPDSVVLGWGFDPPVPDYARHDVETSPDPTLPELMRALPVGFSPELLVWVDSGQPVLSPAYRDLDAVKVAWFIDTHISTAHRIEIARHFDLVFLAQKAQIDEFRAAGISRVAWLPLGCSPSLHDVPPRPRTLDVAFVGSLTSASGEKRHHFIEAVRDAFPNHFIGFAWPHEMAEHYANAKIVVNMCLNEDVNMRVFEALASGALLITDPAIGLEDLFTDGKELVIYREVDEALALIRKYLADDAAREQIAATGQATALKYHSYHVRVEKIVAEARQIAASRPKPLLHHDPKTAEAYYEHPRRELLPAIPLAAKRVLDVGCGAGALGRVLKEERNVEEVCGIEFIEEAYQRARTVLDRVLHGNIETMELPWDDDYFDCIVCADVLEHLVDPAAVMAKLSRVLAPRGVIVISVPNIRFHEVIHMLSNGAWTYYEQGIMDATHLRFFTRSGLRTMIENGGMEAVEIIPLNQRPPSFLPKNDDGSITLGLVTMEAVDDEAYGEFLTYQWLGIACKPGIDRLEFARKALESGEYEAAVAHALDAVGVSDVERYSIVAKGMARLGHLEKAAETYRKLLETNLSPTLEGEFGILLLAMNKAAEARPLLEHALSHQPDFDRADGALGLIEYQAGNHEAAFPRMQRALDANFANRALLESFVDVAKRVNRLDDALPTMTAYLEFYPGNLDLKVTHARVLCELNDFDGARELVELVLLFDPEHAGAQLLAEAMAMRDGNEPRMDTNEHE